MKRWTVETQVLVGFALALGVLAAVGILGYQSTTHFIETSRAVARSQQALTALEAVYSLLNQAETSQRGYLLLGDEADLAPRAAAVARLNERIAELKQLLADDPVLREQIAALEQRAAERLRLLDRVLEVRRTEGFEAARRHLAASPGRHEMRAVRDLVALVQSELGKRLESHQQAARAGARRALGTLALLLAFTVVFLSVLYARIRREMRERRQAQEALAREHERLRESETRLRAILDTAVDGIIVIDERGIIERFNPAAERLFGYRAEEVVGRNVSLLMPSPHRERHDEYIARYLRTGERRIIGIGREETAQRKDGSCFPVELAVSEVHLGNRRAFTGFVRDITERRRAENERLRLIHELESANEELKNFAYVVSHDLKAPLRAIGSLADWLQTDYAERLDAEGREHLRLLINRVRRMDRLIDGILEYSRVGRLHEARVEVDTHALVQEIIELLAPPPHIRVTVEAGLPTIVAERTRLQQVFQNLLSNAIKYMDKPEGRVHVGCRAADGGYEFYVSDNGPGIAARHQEKIFQLFQTLAPRDRVESTGVGLALVKKIVELYGGRVWVDSEPGRGSTFYFTLPRSPAGAVETGNEEAEP